MASKQPRFLSRPLVSTRRVVSTGFVFLILLFLLLASPVGAQGASRPIWSIVKSPNPSTTPISNNYLLGVSALSDMDVWAVGYVTPGCCPLDRTLTEHWNGTSWSIVKSPNIAKQESHLRAVSALSDTDVWAVGDSAPPQHPSNTLIEHWNGTAWSVVKGPNLNADGDVLTGVTALAANNVWAAGWADDAALILHWNGTAWSIVSNGVPFGSVFLHGITAVSASDIWAVGEFGSNPTNLALHWNGTKWSDTASATFPSKGEESLRGVAAASSTDVWAVGFYGPPSGGELQTLALHWDGTKWSQVTTPNVDPDFNLFFGVAAVSRSDVWAVGYAYTPNGLSIHTLIEHWNGTQWSIVPSPNSPATNPSYNQLNGVTVSGSTTLWTVGVFDNEVQGNPGERTLALHTSQG